MAALSKAFDSDSKTTSNGGHVFSVNTIIGYFIGVADWNLDAGQESNHWSFLWQPWMIAPKLLKELPTSCAINSNLAMTYTGYSSLSAHFHGTSVLCFRVLVLAIGVLSQLLASDLSRLRNRSY